MSEHESILPDSLKTAIAEFTSGISGSSQFLKWERAIHDIQHDPIALEMRQRMR